MPLDHGVALPVPDDEPSIVLRRAMLDAHAVGDLVKPCALCLDSVLVAPLGLTEMPPEVATLRLVIPDQGEDPLVTDALTGQGRHETADLLRAPLLTQPDDNGGNHARQALCTLPGHTAPVITQGLGLLGTIAIGGSAAAQFTTDRTAVEAELSAYLPLAHAQVIAGVDLVLLGLCQLSASHALHHFGESRRVPALALLVLVGGPKCCGYSMYPGVG